MEEVQHWGVDVRIDGERVLTIESNSLSGIDNIDKYKETVKECAYHLLSFIGGEKSCSKCKYFANKNWYTRCQKCKHNWDFSDNFEPRD